MNIIFILNYLLTIVNGFISHGFYALTDYRYDGFISNEAIEKYRCGNKNMVSDQMYYSLASAKECKTFCLLNNTCRSFVLDRDNRICYASTFDRCNSDYYTTPLQYQPPYITYDIISGENKTTKTCFQNCLDSSYGNCSACGRMWCSGVSCDNCTITCWDLDPTINSTTYFWLTLNKTVDVTCSKEWQLAYSGGADKTYDKMKVEPLWLQVRVTLSNQSTYNSYFDNITLPGNSMKVGNYLGGPAGNFWNAPDTFNLQNFGNSTCEGFFYKYSFICNITENQIESFKTQTSHGTDWRYVKRGYVWNLCAPIIDKTIYVLNIELFVTSVNYTLANSGNLTRLPLC